MNAIESNQFQFPKSKSHIGLTFLVDAILSFGMFVIMNFMPNFFSLDPFGAGKINFFTAFNNKFIIHGQHWQVVVGSFYWVISIITSLVFFFVTWLAIKQFISYVSFPKWYRKYFAGVEKIINSCDTSKFDYKVAMVVSVCNDVLPQTIVQTAQQTYKNMDVWICDDSSKPEIIQQIDVFAKQHGYFVCRRNLEHKKAHPTKLGNLFYFIEQFGDKYDYVFENDSSSVITSTFVENGLCFLNTPLYEHTHDGGVIANGSFFGTKALLPYMYSKAWQVGHAIGIVGGSVEMSGHPVPMDGWGALYKISTLKQIPISEVECPSCDMARGFWLTVRGFRNYFNPFDFAGKMCTQNIEAVKNQFLKWHGAEIFLFRTRVSTASLHNIKTNIFLKNVVLNAVIFVQVLFVLQIINSIFTAVLNFSYFNITAWVFVVILWALPIITYVIVFLIKRLPLKEFVCFLIFFPLTFMAYVYRKLYQNIVRGFIQKKWSSGAVTVKGIKKSTWKQKLRMGLIDYFFIAFGLILCLLLSFLTTNEQLNKFVIWTSIFTTISLPSIFYIIWIWIGEIPVKTGWSNDEIFPVDQYDFRYKYIKESSVWKKQHSEIK